MIMLYGGSKLQVHKSVLVQTVAIDAINAAITIAFPFDIVSIPTPIQTISWIFTLTSFFILARCLVDSNDKDFLLLA